MMTRRDAIVLGSTLVAGSTLKADETSDDIKLQSTYGFTHKVTPLKFNPKKLRGISEKIIASHHKNNYTGAVKKLNLIRKKIINMPENAHPIEYGALKKEELIALNSKLLHELYFDNLGGSGVMGLQIQEILIQAFSSLEAWKSDFVKTAKSLSGGSGWVILSYLKEQGLITHQIASDHSDSIATGTPLLVLDMYEHSYHIDYGTKAAKYIDAFIDNIDWKTVLQRLKKA